MCGVYSKDPSSPPQNQTFSQLAIARNVRLLNPSTLNPTHFIIRRPYGLPCRQKRRSFADPESKT
ncbi:hypothetical protein COLSTE_02381 [Collinsella stercoris DSM 13279]|uniref:Uncharacterized protein n=1 Tax=Collinsella stercoris DSM 13279 TaxID=445975 RepID=B6GE44_9ACTN|nr:hypothetical protein COLSTE_02381 [Collinsella stercoris DSM 13279]